MSGLMPDWEPASMVTVRENDCDGPSPTTRAGTRARPSDFADAVSPSYSSSRLRS